MRYKIGVVNFLNAYPLVYGLEKNSRNISLVKDVPSRLASMLFEKKIDVALISSIEYYKNRQHYKFHPGLCIGSNGKVESIRLFLSNKTQIQSSDIKLDQPIEKLYFDFASRSSVEMTKIILNNHFPERKINCIEKKPPYESLIENLKPSEGLVLIGDTALKNKEKKSIDMGDWYNRTFQKPFIYALWVFHKNVEIDLNIFTDAYRFARNNSPDLIKEAAETFHFSETFTKEYLENIIFYEMNNAALDGLSFFFNAYDSLNR